MKLKPKQKHGSAAWLQDRFRLEDGGVAFGFSDASALVGASPYKTPAQLYIEKMSGPVVVEENWAMRKGNLMEPLWIQEASHRLGVELITPDVVYTEGCWVGSLDAVPADSWEKPAFIGEVKTTAKYIVNDSGDLPIEWLAQGHIQAYIVQCPVYFIVFDKQQNFNIIEMPYDETFAEKINAKAVEFGELIESKTPISQKLLQDLDASSIAELYPAVSKTIELPPEAEDLLVRLSLAKDALAMVEAQEKELRDELARLLLEADVGTLNGVPAISWKQTAGRESFDTKQFKIDHPELAKQYLKQGKPFRTMRMLKGAISE